MEALRNVRSCHTGCKVAVSTQRGLRRVRSEGIASVLLKHCLLLISVSILYARFAEFLVRHDKVSTRLRCAKVPAFAFVQEHVPLGVFLFAFLLFVIFAMSHNG